jgi:type IV pilus assembly protein PilA
MLQLLRRRLTGQREGGFTLIELMVVVLIIAILIAIAIPTFLGARHRAQDRAAQSSLRNALTAAKTAFTDTQDYGTAVKTATSDPLKAIEPSLSFELPGTASTGQNDVSADASGKTQWAGAALSASGTCFYIHDDVSATGTGTKYGSTTTAADCTGTKALTAASATW